jgi:transposase InsO family protein
MVGPARQREAVRCARRGLGFSERRICRALGVARSTFRYQPKVGAFTRRLLARILELVRQFPRYGYRRITALLRREGWPVNPKRVHRLWKQEGLRVPRKSKKRRYPGRSAHACDRLPATGRNDVWTMDFAWDVTEDGRQLKFLAVVDEYTRECHAIEVDRSIRATDVQDILGRLFVGHGIPRQIRQDNGPEFIADGLRAWLRRRGVKSLFIQPGSPWENGQGESFIGRLRDEFLDREVFASLLEAKVVTEDWRIEYNEVRPHGALGYKTPKAYAAASCSQAATKQGARPGSTRQPVPALS